MAGEDKGADGEPGTGSAVGEDKGSDSEPGTGSAVDEDKGSDGEPDDSDTGSAPGADKAQGWDRGSERLETEAIKAGRGRMSECDSDRSDIESEAFESNSGRAVVPKSERCGDRPSTNP